MVAHLTVGVVLLASLAGVTQTSVAQAHQVSAPLVLAAAFLLVVPLVSMAADTAEL